MSDQGVFRRRLCVVSASDEVPVEVEEAEKDEEESVDSDDEMEPLRDALERAKAQAGKSAFKREALEAEVSTFEVYGSNVSD